MEVLQFTQNGFLLKKEFVFFCYTELLKADDIESGFSQEQFFSVVSKDPVVIDNLLSFIDYINGGMEMYIKDDLNDIIEHFNFHKEKIEIDDIEITYSNKDIEYLKGFIKERFPQYDPYIYEEHIKLALINNYKLLNEVKKKDLKNNDYYRSTLIQLLQHILVGRTEPAPCAKQHIKNQYYELYKDLPRRY